MRSIVGSLAIFAAILRASSLFVPGLHVGGFFVGFRVRTQPQAMNAAAIAQKITNGITCIVCIVVFSVAREHYKPL